MTESKFSTQPADGNVRRFMFRQNAVNPGAAVCIMTKIQDSKALSASVFCCIFSLEKVTSADSNPGHIGVSLKAVEKV